MWTCGGDVTEGRIVLVLLFGLAAYTAGLVVALRFL